MSKSSEVYHCQICSNVLNVDDVTYLLLSNKLEKDLCMNCIKLDKENNIPTVKFFPLEKELLRLLNLVEDYEHRFRKNNNIVNSALLAFLGIFSIEINKSLKNIENNTN